MQVRHLSGPPIWYNRRVDNEYHRDYYAQTAETRRERKRINSLRIKKRNREFVWNYLDEHPCVDCGEDDVVVLQFDHVTDDKVTDVSVMVSSCWSLERIRNEIEKCEVRCANCHTRITAKRHGWSVLSRDVAQLG